MSIEFDDFITAIHKIAHKIEDARLFSIAERGAIKLLLERVYQVNDKVLRKAEPSSRRY